MNEAERRAIEHNDQLARELRFVCTLNPDCACPTSLFKSLTPRLCIDLAPQCREPNAKFHDEVAKSVEKPNALLAAALLALTRTMPAQASSTNFRHAYSWLYGASDPNRNQSVQNSVLRTFNVTQRQMQRSDMSLPKCIAYVEGGRKLWMFFPDGRYDFAAHMQSTVATMRDENLFKAQSGDVEESVLNAMQKCKDFVQRGELSAALRRIEPCFDDNSVQTAANDVSPITHLLHRHMPAAKTESFHNSIAIATKTPFSRLHCNKHVRFEELLTVPAPLVREKFIEERVDKLRAATTKTHSIELTLNKYESIEQDVQQGLCGVDAENKELLREGADMASEERAEQYAENERRELQEGSAEAHRILEGVLNNDPEVVRDPNKKVELFGGIEDVDLEDFRAGRNPNPRVRFLVGGESSNMHGKERYIEGNLIDVLGQNQNPEMRALVEDLGINALQGLGAKEAAATAHGYDHNFSTADNSRKESSMLVEDDDNGSYSARTEAMERKFEEQNCFRRFRRLNNERRKEIEAAHAPGTLEYQHKLEAFKRHAIREAVDPIFGKGPYKKSVTKPVRNMANALVKVKEQLPTMKYLNRELSPFANFDMWVTMDLDEAWSPGPMMEDVKLLFYTAMGGCWHHDNLRPNVLLAGEASTGKSHALQVAASIVPDGVHFAVAHETGKAGLVDGMRVNLLQTMEELPEHMMSSGEEEAKSYEKNRLTSNVLTTVACNHFRNPETGKLERKMEVFHACEEIARQAATNLALPDRNNPQLKRWIVRQVMPSRDPEDSIMNKMNPIEFNPRAGERARIANFWKLFFSVQMIMEKLIEARCIEDVNITATAEINQMLQYLSEKYKFDTNDPKMLKKIQAVCRLITLSGAIYGAVFSEEGYLIRYDTTNAVCDEAGNIDYSTARMRTVEEAAVDMALAVEKYLVSNREHCVYALSLMSQEVLPQLRTQVQEAVRNAYSRAYDVTSTKEGESMRHCPPLHSLLDTKYEYLNLNDDGTKKWRDASCVFVSDVMGSTRRQDVARFIVQNLADNTIGFEHVSRELDMMSNVYIETPIWVLPYNSQPNQIAEPQMLRDENGEVCMQKRPLYYAARVDSSYWHGNVMVDEHSATAPHFRHAERPPRQQQQQQQMGGFNDHQSTLDQHFQYRTEHDPQHPHGQAKTARSSHQKHVWVNLMLYDTIRNPQSHRDILHDAFKSLAHRRQMGKVQTFVTSKPAQVELDLSELSHKDITEQHKKSKAIEGMERVPTVDRKKRIYRFTLYQVPDVVQVRRNPKKFGTITNYRPELGYMTDRRSLMTDGERGRFAKRFMQTENNNSGTLYLDQDLDMIALAQHHQKIGVKFDRRCHYSNLRLRLIKANAARPPEKWQTMDKLVTQHRENWESRKFVGTMQPSADMNEHEIYEHERLVAETCGRASDLIVSSRMLTENEADTRMQLIDPQTVLDDADAECTLARDETDELDEYNLDLDKLNKVSRGESSSSSNDLLLLQEEQAELGTMRTLERSSASLQRNTDTFQSARRDEAYAQRRLAYASNLDVPMEDFAELDRLEAESLAAATAKRGRNEIEDMFEGSMFSKYKKRTKLNETLNPEGSSLSASSSSTNMTTTSSGYVPPRAPFDRLARLRAISQQLSETKNTARKRRAARESASEDTAPQSKNPQLTAGLHLLHDQNSMSESFAQGHVGYHEIDGKE